MSEEKLPSRKEAVRILGEGRAEIDVLLVRLSPRDLTRPGIGGGEWSPKDLIGHLESWEQHALDALAAWARGERAPIDAQIYSRKTSDINAEGVARKARLPYAKVRQSADETHAALLAAIREMPDRRWSEPATPRGRKPLGHRLGGILGGPAGLFRHAEAHLKSVRGFVQERTAGAS